MKRTLTLISAAKLRKFLGMLPSGSYRVFTQKSKKFWIWGVPVLKEFLHKLLILHHPTTQRLPGPAYRPSAPTAREPAPS